MRFCIKELQGGTMRRSLYFLNFWMVFLVISLQSSAYAAPFAYITNASSNTVSVIDTATNLVIATIPVGVGPGGVAVHPDGSRVYVTHGASNTLSVIDT